MENPPPSRTLRRLTWLAVAALVFWAVYRAERREDVPMLLPVGPAHLGLPAPGAELTAAHPFNALPHRHEPELLRSRSGLRSEAPLDIFKGVDPGRLSGAVSDLPLRRRICAGEKLEYSLEWNGMTVATAKLWTEAVESEERQVRVNASVRTHSVISAIYEVKDDVFSVLDRRTGFPHLYSKKQDEGGRLREEYLSVDPASRVALYRRFKNGKMSREVTYDTPRGVADPLGVVFMVRSLDPQHTEAVPLQILGAKRVARTTVRFLPDTEEVSTPLGRFTCHRLVPDLRDEELLEDENRRGDAVLWLEENSGILVKAELTMGLPVGSVSMVLTQWEKGLPE